MNLGILSISYTMSDFQSVMVKMGQCLKQFQKLDSAEKKTLRSLMFKYSGTLVYRQTMSTGNTSNNWTILNLNKKVLLKILTYVIVQ